jgi:hypothetical protein
MITIPRFGLLNRCSITILQKHDKGVKLLWQKADFTFRPVRYKETFAYIHQVFELITMQGSTVLNRTSPPTVGRCMPGVERLRAGPAWQI